VASLANLRRTFMLGFTDLVNPVIKQMRTTITPLVNRLTSILAPDHLKLILAIANSIGLLVILTVFAYRRSV
jgi:hypothetical protein